MKKLMIILALGLFTTIAQATISVNFVDATDGNGDEITGVAGAGEYATSDWINTLRGQTSGANADINSADVSGIGIFARRPNGTSQDFGGTGGGTAAYNGTPLKGFAQAFLNNAEANAAHVELSNLNQAFADGYKIVAYVNGDSTANGGSITINTGVNHTGYDRAAGETYYFKTRYTSSAFATSGYIESDYQTVQPSAASGYAVTDYVVFDNLNADSLTLTVQADLQAKVGLGGFQIVAIPEPATMGFLGMASTGILFLRRKFGLNS